MDRGVLLLLCAIAAAAAIAAYYSYKTAIALEEGGL